MPFPVPFIPKLSYKTGGRKFGAPRASGRGMRVATLLPPPERKSLPSRMASLRNP